MMSIRAAILISMFFPAFPAAAGLGDATTAPAASEQPAAIESNTVATGVKNAAGEAADLEAGPASPAPPTFDRWVAEPRLRCSLPAIRAWPTTKSVPLVAGASRRLKLGPGTAQIILEQRPSGEAGLTRYTVIYEPWGGEPDKAPSWTRMAASVYVAFQDSLAKSSRLRDVQISSPTLTDVAQLKRLSFVYEAEDSETGNRLQGGVVAAPVFRGVLAYVLTLEDYPPDVADAAMRELRRAVTLGLARRPWTIGPYWIGAIIGLPVILLAVIVIRARRKRPTS